MRHYVTTTFPSGRVRSWSHAHWIDENGVANKHDFRWEPS